VDDGDQYRTYVTGDGTSWEHFAPPELAGGRATIGGCAAAADSVVLFGTHDGTPQLWRTVDGRRFEPIAARVAGGIVDAAVDESGGIWVLTTQRRVVQLGPDGRRRSPTALSPEELASPAGAGDVSGLAVTPAHVVILGSWNGGIGLWVADRPQ
jgi:outer membrane protein assembly factor BamB